MNLSQIAGNEASVDVPIGDDGDTVHVVYRPGVWTPEFEDALVDEVRVRQLGVGAVNARILSALMVSWDLIDDTGRITGTPGATVGVDEDTLRKLPARFLDLMVAGVRGSMKAPPEASGTSEGL